MGRTARGVRGMRIKNDQQIISLMVANNEKEILCVSENGFGKRTPVDDFPTHNRGGQGVISLKTSERNGSMVASTLVDDYDGIMLISDKGTMIRTTARQISVISRNTQGVSIIKPKEGEKILECVRISQDDKPINSMTKIEIHKFISESLLGLEKKHFESKLKLIIDEKKEKDKIIKRNSNPSASLRMVQEYLETKNLSDIREILRRLREAESEL